MVTASGAKINITAWTSAMSRVAAVPNQEQRVANSPAQQPRHCAAIEIATTEKGGTLTDVVKPFPDAVNDKLELAIWRLELFSTYRVACPVVAPAFWAATVNCG